MREIPRGHWPIETPTGARVVRGTLIRFYQPSKPAPPISLAISPADLHEVLNGGGTEEQREFFKPHSPFVRDYAKPAIAEFELDDGYTFEATFLGNEWRWREETGVKLNRERP